MGSVLWDGWSRVIGMGDVLVSGGVVVGFRAGRLGRVCVVG